MHIHIRNAQYTDVLMYALFCDILYIKYRYLVYILFALFSEKCSSIQKGNSVKKVTWDSKIYKAAERPYFSYLSCSFCKRHKSRIPSNNSRIR
jgi:hypothetical protein